MSPAIPPNSPRPKPQPPISYAEFLRRQADPNNPGVPPAATAPPARPRTRPWAWIALVILAVVIVLLLINPGAETPVPVDSILAAVSAAA